MIFCLFVLNLLGFGRGRVVRWGRGESVELVYFVVVLGVILKVSLDRE